MRIEVRGPIVFWRGPAPFHFVAVPPEQSSLIAEIAPAVSYGWGMIPAAVTIGATTVRTALWPKDGTYLIPIKTALRTAESLELDDVVDVLLLV